ncbi:SUKH-4 family immunity protein [Streptomyces fungicidicus]|uniref:SUKH-4 family immunity protein n=1 Tax=Streptomyces fungicidicus TaxID=68203 RepID=UPI00384C90D1
MEIQLISLNVARDGVALAVPKEFFGYRSLDEAERVQGDSGRSLIRFGIIGMSTSVYLDESSGRVLSGVDSRELDMVNTTVSRFTQCAIRLAEIFPFYEEGSDVDEWEAGAQRVEDVVREVDPEAYREGAYWYEFRWDVSMGEFYE